MKDKIISNHSKLLPLFAQNTDTKLVWHVYLSISPPHTHKKKKSVTFSFKLNKTLNRGTTSCYSENVFINICVIECGF